MNLGRPLCVDNDSFFHEGPSYVAHKVNELDLPEDPCNPDPEYNFFTCGQKNTTKEVYKRTILFFYRLMFFFRLGVEPSGTTGVTRAHPFVLIANNTGGKITLRILCFFQNHGRLK